MADLDDAHHMAAIQYLIWAVEEIEKAANPKAARHARACVEMFARRQTRSHMILLIERWLDFR